MSFARFFQGNGHFAVKVGFALCGLCFFDIRRNARSGAKNLAHHDAANNGTFIHFSAKLDDTDGKFKSAVNNVPWWNTV